MPLCLRRNNVLLSPNGAKLKQKDEHKKILTCFAESSHLQRVALQTIFLYVFTVCCINVKYIINIKKRRRWDARTVSLLHPHDAPFGPEPSFEKPFDHMTWPRLQHKVTLISDDKTFICFQQRVFFFPSLRRHILFPLYINWYIFLYIYNVFIYICVSYLYIERKISVHFCWVRLKVRRGRCKPRSIWNRWKVRQLAPPQPRPQ